MTKAVLLSLILSAPALASPYARPASAKYVPDEIIVKFRKPVADALEKQAQSGSSLDMASLWPDVGRLNAKFRPAKITPVLANFRKTHQLLNSLKKNNAFQLTPAEGRLLRRLNRAAEGIEPPDLGRIYRVKLDAQIGQSIREALELYRGSPDVEYAEFNYVVSADAVPSERLYPSQWALAKMDAPRAWDVSTGSSDIIVAVIDTGADYNHRDLRDNMWVNEAELNGKAGLDDDGNGHVDDVYGCNFIYNNGDPFDDHGHGTHCAGIIAARGNNTLDIAGVCWNAKIMALKFIGSLGEGTTADAVPAIYYAVQNGADIISNSWGTSGDSKALEESLEYAGSQGLIIVASAGNGNSNMPQYPAAYEHVISVAATDSNDQRWFLSNYGDWVDIAAPGVDILSLKAARTSQGDAGEKYTAVASGTSMAAPHVAGACALVLAANPLLKYGQVYDIVTKGIDPVSADICHTGGRLNLWKLMRAAVPSQGYISFDRDYYPCAGRAELLLADWDLRTRQTERVTIMAGDGDSESVVLTARPSAAGVFTGAIRADAGEPNIEDGTLQISDGQVLAALYFDANVGTGNSDVAVGRAHVDCEAPAPFDLQIRAPGPVATITFHNDEPTTAVIRCGLACGGPYDFVQEDLRLAPGHTIKLYGLSIAVKYYFVIDLADTAGNRATDDNQGLCYSFTTSDEFPGFYVPGVYSTIQQAVDDARNGDTIWVADGTYSGDGNIDVDFCGKAITVRSKDGPERCIIDCGNLGCGFLFHSAEDKDSVLDGFTIKNGRAENFGGGIRCTASSPTIANCIIVDCSSGDSGAAMYNCYNSSPILTNCRFENNLALAEAACVAGKGGAICNIVNCNPTLNNCTFAGNWASYSGGAIYNEQNSNPILIGCTFIENSVGDPNSESGFGGAVSNLYSSPVLTECTFVNNRSGGDGGALYSSYDCDPILANCIFSRNRAKYGGAMKSFRAQATLVNCTLAFNSAESGGGIWNGPLSRVDLTNCILWQNSDQEGADESAQIDSTYSGQASAVNYCCVQGWTGALCGLGNIGLDPLFVDPNAGDYHLSSRGWRWDSERRRWDYDLITSPCIDAGNPGSAPGAEPLSVPDDPNNYWGQNVRIDMGSYGGTPEASMAPPGAALLADLNNDGIVNNRDLALQLRSWPQITHQPGDLNRDGRVDVGDISPLSQWWLRYLRPPLVTITSPKDGALLEIWPVEVEIRADASDVDGPIAMVEFFVNKQSVGRDVDGSDGWQILWRHSTGGLFELTAKATDAAGAPATSDPVRITIRPPR